jgi:ankyrin repeat protein
MRVKVESNLGRGRRQLSAWIRGGLAALAMAVTSSGWGAETLTPSLPAQGVVGKLLQGARQGDLLVVKAAMAEGANVNCRGTNGLTPLLQTMSGATAPFEAGRRQCVAFLLERGAEVDARDRDGRTALIYATRAGDLEAVHLLVEAGAYIVMRDRFHKTALLYAAEGHRAILIYLGTTLKVQRGAAW